MAKNKADFERAQFALDQALLALVRLKKNTLLDLNKAVSILQSRSGKIIITGVGKSGFVGMKMAATLVSLGHVSSFLHPVEALHGDIGMVSDGDVIIVISFSGQSPEIVRIIKYLKNEFAVKIVAITSDKQSSLAKLSDACIRLSIHKEGSPHNLAPMASTTASLVVGDMLAAAITSPQSFSVDHFAKFHPGGGLALSMRSVESIMTSGKSVPLVTDSALFHKVLQEMSRKFIGVTGVVDNHGRLVGIITDGDIRRYFLADSGKKNMSAKDLMSRKPKSIAKNATLKEALVFMEKFRITSLFVIDEKNKPLGIIHIHDIVGGNII